MELYIASKPLQINVASIIADTRMNESCLIIIDMFHDAENVFNKIKSKGCWGKVLFVKNRFMSFYKGAQLQPSKTYIDGDIGTRLAIYLTYFKLFSRTRKLYVYEEGIGTYRNDIYKPSIKTKLFDILGISTVFGGSWFCDGVYVFEPLVYEKNIKIKKENFKILKLEKSIKSYCQDNIFYLNDVYGFNPDALGGGNSSFVYISDWHFDSCFLKSAGEKKFDKKIIKLHPNIKEGNKLDLEGFDILDNKVPAEILIHSLSENYKTVTVLHHGSSVEHYMKYDNVNYVKVSK